MCCLTTSEIKSAERERGGWYCLKMGISAHIFRQSLLEEIHSVALGCTYENCCITYEKKKLSWEKFKLSAQLINHGVKRVWMSDWRFQNVQKRSEAALSDVGKVWGEGFPKLSDHPTSRSDGANWPLKPSFFTLLSPAGAVISLGPPASNATCNRQHKRERGR